MTIEMNIKDMALWTAISAHPLDAAGADLPFSRRLARDNGWTRDFADGAVAEYRRFMYLVATKGEMLTPSQVVDEVWHLHLLYTQDYWERFCAGVLKRPVHHNPADGSTADAAKYSGAYARTLMLYEAEFGPPPTRYWPQAKRPAAPARTKNDMIHLPKRQVFLCLALAGASLLAGCDMKPAEGAAIETWRFFCIHPVFTIVTFLIAYVVTVSFLQSIGVLKKPARKRRDGSSCSSSCGGSSCGGGHGCGSACGSSCGGGCGGH